jgi:NhaA family Na+:H+ antiporter
MPERLRIPPDAWPGIVLLASAILAMAIANSPWGGWQDTVLRTEASVAFGETRIAMPLAEWVKNLLMAGFFLYAGLELKRELKEGALSSVQKALLPLTSAIGGVLVPALLYLATAGPSGYGPGWPIPAATDIAFALGVLALLGSRVPARLKVFLLAVAVVDDLIAVLIVAFVFSGGIEPEGLGWMAFAYAPMLVLNRYRSGALGLYLILAVPLWVATWSSGINPTIAGVLTALAIPMEDRAGKPSLVRLEHALRPYVLYGIMPVFALATAGAAFGGDLGAALLHPVAIGIAVGLVIGKPLGIGLFVLAGSALLRTPRPGNLAEIAGIGCLAGIGFTMSLFIAKLAFPGPELTVSLKLGIYGGSIVSAALGLTILGAALRARSAAEAAEADDTDIFMGDVDRESIPARRRQRLAERAARLA